MHGVHSSVFSVALLSAASNRQHGSRRPQQFRREPRDVPEAPQQVREAQANHDGVGKFCRQLERGRDEGGLK